MEQVILVNDKDEIIGASEKMKAHEEALLHRAFSVFIFNRKGEMLLQKRAKHKYHSGGLWTNACCSHPKPNEYVKDAALRRLNEEMGFSCTLSKMFDFTYKTSFDNGLTEFEYDHVFGGIYNGKIHLDTNEVEEYKYQSLPAIENHIKEHPAHYTAWFIIAFPMVKDWLVEHPEYIKI